MTKKIFSILVAAITTSAICVTAMAADYEYSVGVSRREKYWREFTAVTRYIKSVDEIYAGLQCLRVDTGAAASENVLEKNEHATYVAASVSVDYESYPMLVRAFSNHSAYKNGQQLFIEYDESETA